MGGGPSNTTQTQTSKLPAWAQPFGSQLLNTAGNYFGTVGAQPPQQSTAGFTPAQRQAMAQIGAEPGRGLASVGAGGLSNMIQTGGGTTPGTGMLENTVAGDYLNPATNPYLNATFNEAAQGLTSQYQTATAPSNLAESQMATGGGGASSAGAEMQAMNQYGLGQNLGNLATNIYGGNYEQERQNQLGAAGQLASDFQNQQQNRLSGLGLLPQTQSSLYQPANELLGMGNIQQQQQQNVLNTQFQNQSAQNTYPFQQLGYLGNVFGNAIGNQGTQITTGPNAQATK